MEDTTKVTDVDEKEISDFFSTPTEHKIQVSAAEIVEKPISAWGNDFDTAKASETIKDKPVTVVNQEKKPESIVATITKKEAQASAAVTVGLVDMIQRTVLNIILNKKFEKKFTESELAIFDRVEDIPDEKLEPEELSLKKRFTKSFAKYEKTGESIKFSDDEKDEMKEILEQYYTITGESVSPKLLLFGAFVDKIGKRVATVMFE
jgi:hypothetical protein